MKFDLPGRRYQMGAIGICAVAVCIGAYLTLPERPKRETVTQEAPDPILVRCSLPEYKARPVPDLPLRAMIGQLLVTGFTGKDPDELWPSLIARQLERGQIGGVLFLGKNVSSAKRTRSLFAAFAGLKTQIPPFLMIDQEGGRVQRLGPRVGVNRAPSARTMALKHDVHEARSIYGSVAAVLNEWGLNTNLAPVADVTITNMNPVIARLGRSYSHHAGTVARYAGSFVQSHRDAGILTALKHFPGHGSSRTDSHRELTDISATWQKDRELAPFKALVEGGCADMIMTGHLVLKQYADGEPVPATFSEKVVAGELREGMGYDGIVITDDLDMGAIRKYYSLKQSVTGAIRAGHDILLHSNIITADRDLPAKIIDILQAEALQDPEFERLLRKAFQRVWLLKARLAERKSAGLSQ